MFFTPAHNLLMKLSSSTRVAFVLIFATTLFSEPFRLYLQNNRMQNSSVHPWLASPRRFSGSKNWKSGMRSNCCLYYHTHKWLRTSDVHRSSYHPACTMAHPTL